MENTNVWHLLEETKEVLPHTGLVLCEPFILKTGVTVEKWELRRNRLDEYSGIVRQLSRMAVGRYCDEIVTSFRDCFHST